MARHWLIATTVAIAGCAIMQTTSSSRTLILKPQIIQGNYTQTIVAPYDKASIHHLILKLFIGAQDTGVSKTLLNAQLDNPVVFSNLKDHTTYRVKAYAYSSTDNSTLISFDDANSWTDIPLTDDDRPIVANLKVKLIDKAFDGQATSSLTINPGGYSPISSTSLEVPRVVTTFAGMTGQGASDGLGTAASFYNPFGVAFDPQGNLYVADNTNHRIRKIYPSGLVITFAGSSISGSADGTGTAATFTKLIGISADSSGNIYTADYSCQNIRKITPAGIVTTLAGNGTSGNADGTGNNATFRNPMGLACDNAGNVYVADQGNQRVRKITPAGVVSTLSGNSTAGYLDGTGAEAEFSGPGGLATDGAGNVYVADSGNHRIRKITSTGVVSTIAGSGVAGTADGIGTQASFSTPTGIAVDNMGNIYVADRSSHRIRKISPSGMVTTIAGNGTTTFADGTGAQATFYEPTSIAIDAYGNLFVADELHNRIRRIQ